MKVNFFKKNFTPSHLFILQIVSLILFFSSSSIVLKSIQVFLFYILALLNSKRINIIYFIVTFFSIVFFNLMSYSGRVIYSIDIFNIVQFDITLGALKIGIKKGLNIIGMIFLSLFCIQADLNFSIPFSKYISRSFTYYKKIVDFKTKNKIKKDNLGKKNIILTINYIDSLLFSIFPPENFLRAENLKNEVKKTSNLGFIFIFSFLSLNIIFLIYSKIVF